MSIASANHPFLTIDGWTRLDALNVGSFIGVPLVTSRHRSIRDAGWSDDELVLLAHLIGDGTMGPQFRYATADPANKQMVEETARRLFGVEVRGEKRGNTWQLWFPSPYRLTHGINHPMRNWLEPHGLWQSRAWTKFIPPTVFGLDDGRVALFLRHLWATNGSVTIGANARRADVGTHYATISHRFALDIQRLLLRRGVRSTISTSKKVRTGHSGDGSECYRPEFSVRIHGESIEAALTRFDSTEEADNAATSDLYWDEIIEITAVGADPTFDLTIDGSHNFIADGIIAHNSLEQDADVVMFLYRDEVYNAESADRGTAEVIISKHRNGPTGITHLAFLDHYTRFANMARV